jgi:histidine triad (HIT) family protein
MSCIFCQIIKREKPARLFFEDENVIVFKDIFPKAPIHLLVCPKKHYPNLEDIPNAELILLIERIRSMARELKIEDNYRLLINNGPKSGQIIPHLHWHFLSNADRSIAYTET